jgi:hypothetical protein
MGAGGVVSTLEIFVRLCTLATCFGVGEFDDCVDVAIAACRVV